MTGARNVRGGLVMLSLGLAGGLMMSLYAFKPMVPVPAALAHYDDLPRRLFRLGHIAAIMLPLINVVVGPWLDQLNLTVRLRDAASWLLIVGAGGLPLTLCFEALVPTAIPLHLSALPATGFCLGLFLVSAGAARTPFMKEALHAGSDGRRSENDRDHRPSLQETSRTA